MGNSTDLYGPPLPIRFRGNCDFEALYRYTIKWMKSQEMKVYEPKYKDKVSVADRSEIEISLMGEVKLNEYTRWVMNVDFKTWDSKWIIVEGKRLLMGRIQILISGTIEQDWQETYGANSFTEKLGRVVSWLISKNDDFHPEGPCRDRGYELQNELKKILQIDTRSL